MSGLDWPGLMRAGMRGLGLAPDAFWRLTPAELRLLLGAEALLPPLTRARLEELARAYPDQRKGQGDDGDRDAGRSGPGAGGHTGRDRGGRGEL